MVLLPAMDIYGYIFRCILNIYVCVCVCVSVCGVCACVCVCVCVCVYSALVINIEDNVL